MLWDVTRSPDPPRSLSHIGIWFGILMNPLITHSVTHILLYGFPKVIIWFRTTRKLMTHSIWICFCFRKISELFWRINYLKENPIFKSPVVSIVFSNSSNQRYEVPKLSPAILKHCNGTTIDSQLHSCCNLKYF